MDAAPPADATFKLVGLTEQGKKSEAVKYFMTKVMGMPVAIVFLFKLFGKSLWKKNEEVSHTLSYDIAVMDNFSLPTETASKVKVPAIVVGGGKSPRKLTDAVRAVAQNIPRSKIILLKGQRHNVSMRVLAPVLIQFFKQ